MSEKHSKRIALRFSSASTDAAYLDFVRNDEFLPQIVGIPCNESRGGCMLIVRNDPQIQAGQICQVKIGKLPVISAEIRWTKEVDSDFLKLGLQFLD